MMDGAIVFLLTLPEGHMVLHTTSSILKMLVYVNAYQPKDSAGT